MTVVQLLAAQGAVMSSRAFESTPTSISRSCADKYAEASPKRPACSGKPGAKRTCRGSKVSVVVRPVSPSMVPPASKTRLSLSSVAACCERSAVTNSVARAGWPRSA